MLAETEFQKTVKWNSLPRGSVALKSDIWNSGLKSSSQKGFAEIKAAEPHRFSVISHNGTSREFRGFHFYGKRVNQAYDLPSVNITRPKPGSVAVSGARLTLASSADSNSQG